MLERKAIRKDGHATIEVQQVCKCCTNLFWSERCKHRTFCSRKCARIVWCKEHHDHFIQNNNPNYKTGTVVSNGYKYKISGMRNDKTFYRPEHCLIFEKYHNIKLGKNDVVHHKDMNKTNNDINNLMVFESDKSHIDFHYRLTKNLIKYVKQTCTEQEADLLLTNRYFKE